MKKPKDKPEKFDQLEMDLEHCAANFKLIGIHLNSIASYLKSNDSKLNEAKMNSIVNALDGSCRTIDKLKLDSMFPKNSRCSISMLQFQHRLELISRYFSTPDKNSSQLSKVTRALDNINRSFEGLKLPRSK